MEHTIPALLIAAILVFGSIMMAAVTNSSLKTVNESWREVEALAEERLGTDLTVVSSQVSAPGTDITVVVKNQGRTPVRDPSLMDIVMNYPGTDGKWYARWIPYKKGALQDNTWTVTGMIGDYHNPGILDTGEEMQMEIQVNPATGSGPNRWLVISTETGISYTVYF